MTAKRRRAAMRANNNNNNNGETDIEVIVGESALHSLDDIETSVKAFQHVWRQGLMFMGIAFALIYGWMVIKSITSTTTVNNNLVFFYLHSTLSFMLTSRWLHQVDVILEFPENKHSIGGFNEPFRSCVGIITLQCIFYLGLVSTQTSDLAYKCIPTSLFFLLLAICCVAYSRYHVRSYYNRRKQMENVLFDRGEKME
jgi:hypothetical protein